MAITLSSNETLATEQRVTQQTALIVAMAMRIYEVGATYRLVEPDRFAVTSPDGDGCSILVSASEFHQILSVVRSLKACNAIRGRTRKTVKSYHSANKAYWLGALAADGCIYYKQNKWIFQFIVSQADQEWLYTFRDEIQSTHPLRVLPGGFGTPCIRLVIVNQQFTMPLIEIGLKSEDILNRIPERLWPHFIRGLFDGDGCIHKDVGKPRHTGYVPWTLVWSLLSQSPILLQHIQAIFQQSCNIAPSKMRFHNNAWKLAVRGNRQVKRIAEYMYPEGQYPFLARKREKFVF